MSTKCCKCCTCNECKTKYNECNTKCNKPCNECMPKCGLRVSFCECKTVLFLAAMSAFLITGIFTLLSNIDTIEISPKFDSKNGLQCHPHNGEIYDFSEQCNITTDKMYAAINRWCYPQGKCDDGYMDVSFDGYDYNSTYNDSRSQCGSNCTGGQYRTFKNCTCACELTRQCIDDSLSDWGKCETDTSSDSLYQRFSSFKIFYIMLIICTAVYGLFAAIHDFTLIHYKDNLEVVSFAPSSWDDCYLLFNTLKVLLYVQLGCDCPNIIRVILFFFILVAALVAFVLDFIFISTLYPFIGIFIECCCRTKLQYKVPTICYISASWVGLSRVLMMFAIIGMTWKITEGFSTDVTSLDPNECDCECMYILHKRHFYSFLGATLAFIGLNTYFLWTWFQAARYGKYYLYLVEYRLSIEQAHKMNPTECTGSMLTVKNFNGTQEEEEQQQEDAVENVQELCTNDDAPVSGAVVPPKPPSVASASTAAASPPKPPQVPPQIPPQAPSAAGAPQTEIEQEENEQMEHKIDVPSDVEVAGRKTNFTSSIETPRSNEEEEEEKQAKEEKMFMQLLYRGIVLFISIIFGLVLYGFAITDFADNNFYQYPDEGIAWYYVLGYFIVAVAFVLEISLGVVVINLVINNKNSILLSKISNDLSKSRFYI